MVCYHLDRFSSFVASDGFFVLYDISAEEKKKILSDDTELMLFGFRFLKQILYGENAITLGKDAQINAEKTIWIKRKGWIWKRQSDELQYRMMPTQTMKNHSDFCVVPIC